MSSFDNYTTPQALLEQELSQRRESGFDTSEVQARIAGTDVKGLTSAEAEDHLAALAIATPVPDWPYVEPTDLEAIVAEFPRDPFGDGVTVGAALPVDLDDRIAGAWLGRCAGNCLGKPVENGDIWSPDALRDYLTATGNYPIDDYVTNSPTMPEGLRLVGNPMETTAGNIRYVPRDDDLDYTLLGLHLMERHGRALTTADVADAWLSLLPYGATYTAERATYRSLVAGVAPESAGWRDNPYREWIGAQIRADIYGYVLPGRPLEAARLAWQDARLSHVANGVYGEMWAAAFVACAFTAASLVEAFDRALAYVPARSRLAEALRWVRSRHADGIDWETLVREIHDRYGELHWVHTVNNAAAVGAAILTCGEDFTTAIGQMVASGLDTDSNGATAGSIAGAFVGAAAIPDHWTAAFDDRIRSALFGFDNSVLSEVISRTQRLAHDWS